MLKQGLSQKLSAKLSPQQIQLMKLLQIPTATLDQRIKEELEANPALDEGEEETEESFEAKRADDENGDGEKKESEEASEDFELDEYINEYIEDDPSSYKLKANHYSADDEDKTMPVVVTYTFHEYLEEQLGLLDLDPKMETIGKQVIGSINEDGYLTRDTLSLIDDLVFSHNVAANEDEINDLIKRIQKFDPPGVGAKNLQECLELQLQYKLDNRIELKLEDDIPSIKLAIKVIQDYFNEFSKKHYQKLQRQLGITEDQLKAANNEILKLNPKPASGHSGGSSSSSQYIIPDFIIVNREGELDLSLNNRNAPDLRINDTYKDMLKSYKDRNKGDKKNGKRVDKRPVSYTHLTLPTILRV